MIMDNIICCNCNYKGLVSPGEERCPSCNMKGCLAWADEENKEISL